MRASLRTSPFIAAASLVTLAACGPGPVLADAGTQALTATNDAGVSYAAPLTVTAMFMNSPLALTGNEFHVTVRDAHDAGVEGATVTLKLWMPAMGHGGPVPSSSDEGEGHYHFEPVNFSMAGTWEATGTATLGGLSASQTVSVAVP